MESNLDAIIDARSHIGAPGAMATIGPLIAVHHGWEPGNAWRVKTAIPSLAATPATLVPTGKQPRALMRGFV